MGSEALEADLFRYALPFSLLPVPDRALCSGYLDINLYTGKILKDEDSVATHKIEEKGYIVCMVSKVCVTHGLLLPFGLLTLRSPSPLLLLPLPRPPRPPAPFLRRLHDRLPRLLLLRLRPPSRRLPQLLRL